MRVFKSLSDLSKVAISFIMLIIVIGINMLDLSDKIVTLFEIILFPMLFVILSNLCLMINESSKIFIDIKIFNKVKFDQIHKNEKIMFFDTINGVYKGERQILEIENTGSVLITNFELIINPSDNKRDKLLSCKYSFAPKDKLYIIIPKTDINKIYTKAYFGSCDNKHCFYKCKKTKDFMYFNGRNKRFEKYKFKFKKENIVEMNRLYVC